MIESPAFWSFVLLLFFTGYLARVTQRISGHAVDWKKRETDLEERVAELEEQVTELAVRYYDGLKAMQEAVQKLGTSPQPRSGLVDFMRLIFSSLEVDDIRKAAETHDTEKSPPPEAS